MKLAGAAVSKTARLVRLRPSAVSTELVLTSNDGYRQVSFKNLV